MLREIMAWGMLGNGREHRETGNSKSLALLQVWRGTEGLMEMVDMYWAGVLGCTTSEAGEDMIRFARTVMAYLLAKTMRVDGFTETVEGAKIMMKQSRSVVVGNRQLKFQVVQATMMEVLQE